MIGSSILNIVGSFLFLIFSVLEIDVHVCKVEKFFWVSGGNKIQSLECVNI